jgi:transcriptional regulator with XRE-family HTH domain
MRRACLHTDVPKRLTDEQRGPLATWIVRQREARGWKQDSMAGRLAEKGYRVRDDYYRQVESGKKPGPDFLSALEALFETGYVAPVEPEPEPAAAPSSDIAQLLEAIAQQLQQIAALTGMVTSLVERLDRQATELPEWAEATVRAAMAGVQLGTAAKGSSAPPAPDGPRRSRSGSEG